MPRHPRRAHAAPAWIIVMAVLACGVLMSRPIAAQEAAPPRRQPASLEFAAGLAFRTVHAMRIDGILNEEDWRHAVPIGTLAQSEPEEQAPASQSTEVRVLFDEDAIYFGIECFDDAPGAIVSTQLARDANLDVDDHVTVILDPFFDHRNGFYFQVNPSGARTDGQVANNAPRLLRDWDGIWDAAARITERGWVAEIAIPFKTLRFKPGQNVWGLNVERQIKRRNETDRWSGPRRSVWIGNLAEAGRLEGLTGIRQGTGLDVRPYLIGNRGDQTGKVEPGIDIFKNITPNLNAAVTVNTDFAETEADARQVNLTRFSLFFPEKRAFFLEGAGLFEVGGFRPGMSDLLPFFSRRIGLRETDGTAEVVPILAGAKITGREGPLNVGFLDVQTRDTHAADGSVVRGENLLAARVSYNLFEQSWVGASVTHGNPAGGGSNTLLGADAQFVTSRFRGGQNLSAGGYLFRTSDEASGTADYLGGIRLEYPNDRWNLAFRWKQVGENFKPALGWIPRTGIRKTNITVAFQPRPHALGIRQFFFEFMPEVITNLQGRVDNWRLFTAPVNLRTDSGEHLEWNPIPEFERLVEPFEIATGVVIPPGAYRWTRYRAEANTATKRPWVVDAQLGWGGFYDGRRRQVDMGVTLKPNTHVLLALRVERNDVTLRAGKFFTQLFSLRGEYNFSPDTSWATFAQYDSESRILGVQSRFRWILKPGSDLFLVFNRGWLRSLDDGAFRSNFQRDSIKLQYTFRL